MPCLWEALEKGWQLSSHDRRCLLVHTLPARHRHDPHPNRHCHRRNLRNGRKVNKSIFSPIHEEGSVDFRLTGEQRMWQEAVHDFVAREVKPKAREVDETSEFNWGAAHKMGSLGLLGLNVAEEYG